MNDHQQGQKNQYGQLVGYPVALTPTHYVADTVYGAHATLQVLSTATLTPARLKQLWQATQTEVDDRCWTYLPYLGFKSAAQLHMLLQDQFGMQASIHYLIEIEHKTVGWIGLLNERAHDCVIEIGNIYFSAQMKQSVAASEVIYLLLNKCFEQGFRRIEWKCDALNMPSKRAALRFGFQYEGTFRQDRITKGRNRDTAWFSMLETEWPQIKKAYLAWLAVDNFDAQDQQNMKLADLIEQYVG